MCYMFVQPVMSCQLASCSSGQQKKFGGMLTNGRLHMGCLIRTPWMTALRMQL